ncbi:MAG: hypothetical protein P4N41_21450 [Negativicutes bacterium]|nr:hypothetical protein [Negativicutes bacterium]
MAMVISAMPDNSYFSAGESSEKILGKTHHLRILISTNCLEILYLGGKKSLDSRGRKRAVKKGAFFEHLSLSIRRKIGQAAAARVVPEKVWQHRRPH